MKRIPARHRPAVAARVVTAIAGGYVFTWLFTAALALCLRDVWLMPRVDAALAATMCSFLVYAGAIIAVFSARSAARAWAGLLIASVPPALVIAFLGRGPLT
jgi:hypothetical protein